MAAARSFSPAVAGASSEPFSSGSRRRSLTYISTCCAASSSNSPANGFPISAKPALLDRSAVGSRCSFPRCDATSDPEIVAASEPPTSTRASSFSALEQLKASAGDRYTREQSSIAVIGLSVHTAPVEMREKLAVPEALWSRATSELCDLHHIEEAAVLSTCNRMEIYVVALSWNRGIREVMAWMSKISGIPVGELRQHLFMLRDGDAIRHLFQVSSGLDSLVLGEGQILAQVKQVVRIGQASGGLGKVVDRLFKDAITAGKRVRSETNISSGAVSVSSAAVELALSKLPRSRALSARMLVVGAGKMGRLVIKHLAAKGCTSVVVVNRSAERVSALRDEMKDEIRVIYKPLTEMHACAGDADVIFTSTASEAPLFLRRDVEFLPPASEALGGSRLFVDIAVPRNVGSCVSGAGTARVFNVDDLKEVVEANREDRLRKAAEAQSIIGEELRRFEAWRDSLETVPTIKGLRSYADRIRLAELEKCLQKIGDDELRKRFRKALDEMSSGIVNKLLHGPLQHLRCDGGDSRDLDEMLDNMHALNRMFSLGTDKSVLEQKIKSKVQKAQR